MKCNDCKCNMSKENLAPICDNPVTYSNLNCNKPCCNMPVKRYLEPVLIAKIYNQPIVEELPYSAMSLKLDNTACISDAHSDMIPICGNECMDGYNYTL